MSFLEEEFVIIDPAGKRIVHINVKILEKIPIMFSFINFLDYSIVVLLHFCDISKAFSDILVYKKVSFVQFTWKKVLIYTFIRKENAKQHPETELLLFKNYSYSLYMLSPKNNRTYSKNKQKNKRVCIHEIIWVTIMKMNIKMKNRSHRYYINRPRSRRWHKYKKHKKDLTMIMFTRMLNQCYVQCMLCTMLKL